MEELNAVTPGIRLNLNCCQPQRCHTMNGNCVLNPKAVAKLVGNLGADLIHSTGDLDYGFRLRQQVGSVWLTPGFIGTCQVNS